MESKKPWFSKTIIINAIAGLSIALSPFIPALAGVNPFIQSHIAVIGSAWAMLNIIVRLITKNAVSLED